MLKGDIYLVDFGKSKDSFSFGKNRPAIIFQTDKLNYAVNEEIKHTENIIKIVFDFLIKIVVS